MDRRTTETPAGVLEVGSSRQCLGPCHQRCRSQGNVTDGNTALPRAPGRPGARLQQFHPPGSSSPTQYPPTIPAFPSSQETRRSSPAGGYRYYAITGNLPAAWKAHCELTAEQSRGPTGTKLLEPRQRVRS